MQFSSIPPEDDRISDLPDSLIHHILSFLLTKDAAAMIILSKRWKSLLCLSNLTLNLNLDHQTFPNPLTFPTFLDSLITYREKPLSILQFSIPNTFHLFDVGTLILNCKTLVVLNLKGLVFDKDPYVDLPSLKFLRLESVTFTHSRYLINILSGCPILEELQTKDLIVEGTYRVPHPLPHFAGIFRGLSKLVRANISGRHIMYSFLNNAKHLQLHVTVPFQPHNMFHNLTYLEITLDLAPIISTLKWPWLIFMLPKFPKLQTLIIDEVDTVNNLCKREWVDPKIVPECLLSRLTTCSLRNYSRINWELPFVKYIMKNSRVLSTMTIQVAKSVESDKKLQFVKELSLCPKISATCELLII